jgi:hypothetical protein
LLAAGCAAPAASSKGRSLQSVAGVDKSEALRKADAICHEYGRAAFADVYDDATRLLTFRCLEP